MNIHETSHDGITVLAPEGRIDTTTSSSFDDVVRRTIEGGAKRIVVDMEGVEYISSAGLRVFLLLAKRMRDLSGRLVVCGMTQPVKQVFQLAGFLPLFTVTAGRQDALAQAGTHP